MNELELKNAFDQALSTYKQDFGTFFLARFLGLEIAYDTDVCVIEFEVKNYMFNPQGSLHGGVIATVMDISMGHLLKHVSGSGATLEMKVQYLRPVKSGRMKVVGRFIKQGREIYFLASDALNEDGKIVASASATWKRM